MIGKAWSWSVVDVMVVVVVVVIMEWGGQGMGCDRTGCERRLGLKLRDWPPLGPGEGALLGFPPLAPHYVCLSSLLPSLVLCFESNREGGRAWMGDWVWMEMVGGLLRLGCWTNTPVSVRPPGPIEETKPCQFHAPETPSGE